MYCCPLIVCPLQRNPAVRRRTEARRLLRLDVCVCVCALVSRVHPQTMQTNVALLHFSACTFSRSRGGVRADPISKRAFVALFAPSAPWLAKLLPLQSSFVVYFCLARARALFTASQHNATTSPNNTSTFCREMRDSEDIFPRF